VGAGCLQDTLAVLGGRRRQRYSEAREALVSDDLLGNIRNPTRAAGVTWQMP
jgi:hypothetical protein